MIYTNMIRVLFFGGLSDLKLGLNGKTGLEIDDELKSCTAKRINFKSRSGVDFNDCRLEIMDLATNTNGISSDNFYHLQEAFRPLNDFQYKWNLKEKNGYNTVEWVMYITKAGALIIVCCMRFVFCENGGYAKQVAMRKAFG
ncbi:hypothetical protein R6Q57_013190 [Mikania cordata]